VLIAEQSSRHDLCEPSDRGVSNSRAVRASSRTTFSSSRTWSSSFLVGLSARMLQWSTIQAEESYKCLSM